MQAANAIKVSSNVRKMRKLRSSCACKNYYPGLCSPFIQSVVSNDSFSGQLRPWSACADAQGGTGPSLSAYARKQIFAWRKNSARPGGRDVAFFPLFLMNRQSNRLLVEYYAIPCECPSAHLTVRQRFFSVLQLE